MCVCEWVYMFGIYKVVEKKEIFSFIYYVTNIILPHDDRIGKMLLDSRRKVKFVFLISKKNKKISGT